MVSVFPFLGNKSQQQDNKEEDKNLCCCCEEKEPVKRCGCSYQICNDCFEQLVNKETCTVCKSKFNIPRNERVITINMSISYFNRNSTNCCNNCCGKFSTFCMFSFIFGIISLFAIVMGGFLYEGIHKNEKVNLGLCYLYGLGTFAGMMIFCFLLLWLCNCISYYKNRVRPIL